jgi:hypothetical protein
MGSLYKTFFFKRKAEQYAEKLKVQYGCRPFVIKHNWFNLGGNPFIDRWGAYCTKSIADKKDTHAEKI